MSKPKQDATNNEYETKLGVEQSTQGNKQNKNDMKQESLCQNAKL